MDHASDAIRDAERRGMAIEYTTNNSSRFQSVVADQLIGFGLSVEPRQVITSSVVAARMVARAVPHGAKVLVVGAEHLREEIAWQGLEIVERAEDDPAAVVQGWYPDMTRNQLAQAAFAVERGAAYYVTNRDLTIPRELGIAPDAGRWSGRRQRHRRAARGLRRQTGIGHVRRGPAVGGRRRRGTRPTGAVHGHRRPVGHRYRGGQPRRIRLLAVLTGVTNPHELMLAPGTCGRPSSPATCGR